MNISSSYDPDDGSSTEISDWIDGLSQSNCWKFTESTFESFIHHSYVKIEFLRRFKMLHHIVSPCSAELCLLGNETVFLENIIFISLTWLVAAMKPVVPQYAT